MTIPEEFGGLGLNTSEECHVVMELGRTSPAFRSVIGTNNGIGSQGLVMDGTEAQKAHYLPKMASGEIIGSFALTEPEAGSDAGSLTTRRATARRRLRHQRHEALHHERAASAVIHRVRPHRSGEHAIREAFRRFSSTPQRRRNHAGAEEPKDGSTRRPRMRRDLRRLLGAGSARCLAGPRISNKGFLTAMKTLDRGRCTSARWRSAVRNA